MVEVFQTQFPQYCHFDRLMQAVQQRYSDYEVSDIVSDYDDANRICCTVCKKYNDFSDRYPKVLTEDGKGMIVNGVIYSNASQLQGFCNQFFEDCVYAYGALIDMLYCWLRGYIKTIPQNYGLLEQCMKKNIKVLNSMNFDILTRQCIQEFLPELEFHLYRHYAIRLVDADVNQIIERGYYTDFRSIRDRRKEQYWMGTELVYSFVTMEKMVFVYKRLLKWQG